MHEAEEAESLLDAGLRALFAADLPVGLALLDRELRYVVLNPALAAFNGVSSEQARGRSVAEVLPEAFPTLEPRLRAVLDEGAELRNFQVQIEVPSRPGELSEWEASYLPVRGADGAVLGVLVQAVNVTAQRRADHAMRRSEAHLRQVLDSCSPSSACSMPTACWWRRTARRSRPPASAPRMCWASPSGIPTGGVTTPSCRPGCARRCSVRAAVSRCAATCWCA
ncbi:MAG: PAS domain-containing protein [Inhella sp.]